MSKTVKEVGIKHSLPANQCSAKIHGYTAFVLIVPVVYLFIHGLFNYHLVETSKSDKLAKFFFLCTMAYIFYAMSLVCFGSKM